MINWAFYEPGSECTKNWQDDVSNEDYWTKETGQCFPMNTRSGEYDVVVGATNVGLNTITPAMYACPDKNCDLANCILMAAEGWAGGGMGCQHMYTSPYWWINGVEVPMKRDVMGEETDGTESVGLGPRRVMNVTESENGMRLRKIEFKA